MIADLQANISERNNQIAQLVQQVEAIKLRFPEGIADSQARGVPVGPLLKTLIDDTNAINQQIADLQAMNAQDEAMIAEVRLADSATAQTPEQMRMAQLELAIAEAAQIAQSMAALRDSNADSPFIAQSYEQTRLQALADKNQAELELRALMATSSADMEAIQAEQDALDLFKTDELSFYESFPGKLSELLYDGGADEVEATRRIVGLYQRTVSAARGAEDQRFTDIVNAALGTQFAINDLNRILVEAGLRELADVPLTMARATGGDAEVDLVYRDLEAAAGSFGVTYQEVAELVGEQNVLGYDTVELVESPDGLIQVETPAGGVGYVDGQSVPVFEETPFDMTKPVDADFSLFPEGSDVFTGPQIGQPIEKPIFLEKSQPANAGLLIAAGIAALTILG